jgi:hypothetical protein
MPTEDHPTYPCPGCGAGLPAVGEFELEGRGFYPAYCCENDSCAITMFYSVPFTVINGTVLKLPTDAGSISDAIIGSDGPLILTACHSGILSENAGS